MDSIIHLIINQNLLRIYHIINRNLLDTTNYNSISIIEEHNKLIPKMVMIEKKWENMEIFILEYLHLKKKYPIFHYEKNIMQEIRTQLIILWFINKRNYQDELKNSHCQIFNQKRRNNILHLLSLNQVVFQLKLIIVLKLNQN